jgi:hypothetical protein
VSPARPELVLHIERLVLDGFALGPGGAARVRRALETALAAELGPGLAPELLAGGASAEATGGEIAFAADAVSAPAGATELGRRIGSGLGARLRAPGGLQ